MLAKYAKPPSLKKNRWLKNIILHCPHCNKILDKIKERSNFLIYKCKNDNCKFYRKNVNAFSKDEKILFKKSPHLFKVRYIYRAFDISLPSLVKSAKAPLPSIVDLAHIYFDKHILGLLLTYHINYGLSTRKTAGIMKDVHGVSLSHQTVSNYASSTASVIKPFLDDFNYDLTEFQCGDETYVKVKGKIHYVFFIFDSVKKIISSYEVFKRRDTISAIKAIYTTLSKFRSIPENLYFVFDGNPIYLAAQHFFAQNNIHFNINQVIGLCNNDPVSKEYRPLKQIIERLNRTLKWAYCPKNGFRALIAANSFITLFTTYFNFLRKHSSLNNKVPVEINELKGLPHMPAKWIKLIELSYQHIEKLQQKSPIY